MGELLERIKLNNLVYGNGITENFKNNSTFFYNKYNSSDDEVTNIPLSKIKMGGFYFFHYMDDSNWMKYSPVFTVEFKNIGNIIVVMAIDFNFIPLEIRATIFDKYIKKEDFDKNKDLNVDYQGVYIELLKYGFEYALVEYNLIQIKYAHKIKMDLVPRFLYSQHPINKYDPNKLYGIWKAKIVGKEARNKEMMTLLISDLFKASDDIIENYEQLKNHITRVQTSYEKYGS